MRARQTLLTAALLLASALAVAAPAQEAEQALAVGHDALEHFKGGDWPAALQQFRKADSLAHSPVFTLFAARCERELGQLLAARRSFRRVIDEPLAGDAPAAWRSAVADARRELDALERQIPRVVVRIEGPEAKHALVSLNGRTLRRADLNTPIEADPGKITVVARVGTQQVLRELTLTAGSDQQVVLRLPPTKPTALSSPTPASTQRDPAPQSRSYLAPGVAFGVGAAGIVAGTVLGLLASSKASDIKSRCQGNSCLASDAGAGTDATHLANASTIAFIIGGVGIGGGITLLLLPSEAGARQVASAQVAVPF